MRERVGGGGTLNAFLLGVAFSFAFCPTLALLFFGYVIPTTIKSATGHLHGNPGSAVEQG